MVSPDASWNEILAWVGGSGGAFAAAIWTALRKPKSGAVTEQHGMGQVLMATFTERTQMAQMIDGIERLTEGMGDVKECVEELVGIMRDAANERREERARRDQEEHDALRAAVKALSDRDRRPI